jgi:hypothetical protein
MANSSLAPNKGQQRSDDRIKIFISYAREDSTPASELYESLIRERERKPWLDTNSVLPGEKWKQVVSAEIKKSRFFIALISKNSVKRGYVQKELKEALEILDEFPESGVFIIPVRLEAINISDSRLEQIQYVDLFPSWGEASKRY